MAIRIREAKRGASNLLLCQLESNEGNVEKTTTTITKNTKNLDGKPEDLPTMRDTSTDRTMVCGLPRQGSFRLQGGITPEGEISI